MILVNEGINLDDRYIRMDFSVVGRIETASYIFDCNGVTGLELRKLFEEYNKNKKQQQINELKAKIAELQKQLEQLEK